MKQRIQEDEISAKHARPLHLQNWVHMVHTHTHTQPKRTPELTLISNHAVASAARGVGMVARGTHRMSPILNSNSAALIFDVALALT